MDAIRIEHLTKVYRRSMRAIDDISLTVRMGCVVGFLGPNGAGKTTTAKILTALISPTSGSAYVNDIDVNEDPKTALSVVGSIVETPEFYPQLTPISTLRFLGRLRGMDDASIAARIDELLETLRLKERSDSRIGGFSKGMKQRLAIAQALLHDPSILILDEPTGGLDPRGMVEIRELIKSLKMDGKTIFMNSHLLSEVYDTCDHVALIDKGHLLMYDAVENIQNASSSCSIEVELAEAPSDLISSKVREIESIVSMEFLTPKTMTLVCSGDIQTRHRLLLDLLSIGLKVSSFAPNSSILEQVYLDRIQDDRGE